MDVSLGELCVNGVLKLEHKHLEDKGLTHITHLPQSFQIKWIKYILSQVHDGRIWLEQLIEIMKKMIHHITGLPMLAKAKTTKTLGWVCWCLELLDNKKANITMINPTQSKDQLIPNSNCMKNHYDPT